MKTYIATGAALVLSAAALALVLAGRGSSPEQTAEALQCVQANSSGSTSCQDAGNFTSTCAVAQCPTDYTLTGGGGICAAGNSKLKGANPRLSTGEFFVMCEEQGVDPQARAICCKL